MVETIYVYLTAGSGKAVLAAQHDKTPGAMPWGKVIGSWVLRSPRSWVARNRSRHVVAVNRDYWPISSF